VTADTVDNAQPSTIELPSESRLQEIHARLRKLERRDWWLWVVAIVVMLLLTLAIFSLSFPGLMQYADPMFQFSLNEAVRGLVGLVLLFNSYSIYQQVQIKRLRRQLSGQLDSMNRLVVRAEEFQKQATIDPLTGLYNRRFAKGRLEAEASRSLRYARPLTVVSFDLNKFKEINDRYGHGAGDEALVEFAKRLTAAIRVSDVPVRMGGDEFLAILPECPVDAVQTMLNRLSTISISWEGKTIAVNYSAGWVAYEQGETPEQFLERADRTLYANKRAGQDEPKREKPAREAAETVGHSKR
jgi:diguanylate cyclase (GGDEF)-like protein